MSDETRHSFIAALAEVAHGAEPPLSDLTALLRETLVAFGSETPDNLDCARRLRVAEGPSGSSAPGERTWRGLAVGDASVRVSDVLNAAEGCPVPTRSSDGVPT